ncbi:hypothetical protein [Variovorax sp.]|uniref:hypothetical protein n=1 Tax=Variovorax sp. TaxID=1871043 RepID=UPI002D78C18D|nr:hypothetical protein [Variovorax sp.]
MSRVIGLLDLHPIDPERARRALDIAFDEGALSARQRQAVRILFLLPTADANDVLLQACKDTAARQVFLRLRGQ